MIKKLRKVAPLLPYVFVMTAFLAGLCICEWRGVRLGTWLTKPAAALTFVAAALAMGALDSDYGRAMLTGLALCVGGDVLLIPKSDRAFLAGLASFLLGHVAYAVAFAIRGVELVWTLSTLLVLGGVAALVGRWLLPHVRASMKKPVLAYMTVITAMVALSVGTVAHGGNALVFVGAFAFYLSDLCVARERFVRPGLVNKALGLPLYFGAQLVLASTVG